MGTRGSFAQTGWKDKSQMIETQFRELPDGRILGITPLTFGRARITIGLDKETYEDGY